MELLALAERQAGLMHYDQLAEHGVTRGQLRGRLGTEWRLVLPRVVTTGVGPLDDRQRLVAALLYAGSGAMITGAAAARWHGITEAQEPVVAIEVPHSRRPRGGGFVDVRRTLRPDPHPWQRPPLVLVSRQRAVAVAARDCRTERDAAAVVLEAVQRRLVRLHDVRNELEAGPRAGSARLRRAVEAAERGAWSAPEAELTALLEKSRLLPPAWLNPHLFTTDGVRLPTPDGWFDDVGLAVQVHSKRYHADELDWEKTVSGDGVFRRIRDRTRRGDTPTDRGAARCCPHPHRARV
jgi:hypothetical protein